MGAIIRESHLGTRDKRMQELFVFSKISLEKKKLVVNYQVSQSY
jgi:hypothetical protein